MSAQPTTSAAADSGASLTLAKAQVDANAAARDTIVAQVFAQVASLINSFHVWYDDLAVRRLGKSISDVVQAGQLTMAQAEDAYMSWAVATQAGRTVRPAGQIAVDDLRKGVDPQQVYERLGEQFRYSRSVNDGDEAKALQATLTRASVMVDTDVALAARAQAQKTMQSTPLAIGYRRVIHPELSKSGTCGMCIVASDRVYKKADLLPIHARCRCEIAPITKDSDPGSSLNNIALGDLYDDAQGSQRESLKRTRYTVEHHDQLGPQLTLATAPKTPYKGRQGAHRSH